MRWCRYRSSFSLGVIVFVAATAAHADPSVVDALREKAKKSEPMRLGKESTWLVPGDTAVPIETPANAGSPLPWTFRLVASTSQSDVLTTDVQKSALHCTASVVLRANKLMLYTAAHCLVLPGRKLPTRFWLTRKGMSPEQWGTSIKPESLSFQSTEVAQWVAKGPTTDALEGSIVRLLRPSETTSEWLSDVASITLDGSKYPKAWQAYPWSTPTLPTAAGEEVLLAGGGCTSADRTTCSGTVAYAMYADRFLFRAPYEHGFSIDPLPTEGSTTQVGDSGGPVLFGKRLVGVVSTSINGVTFIERIN